MEIITRQQAKEIGAKYYFTGKPCKRGHLSNRDTLKAMCVDCYKEYKKQNPEIYKNSYKNWYEKNRPIALEAMKNYAKENKDKIKSYYNNWKKENLELVRENARKYARNNPDKVRANTAKRRARIFNSEGQYSKEDINRIKTEQNHLCNICSIDVSVKYHVDHIYPISKGGKNVAENIQILCPTCNLKKGNKIPACAEMRVNCAVVENA